MHGPHYAIFGRVAFPPGFWLAVGGAAVGIMTLLAIALPTPTLPDVRVAMIGNSMMVRSWVRGLYIKVAGTDRTYRKNTSVCCG